MPAPRPCKTTYRLCVEILAIAHIRRRSYVTRIHILDQVGLDRHGEESDGSSYCGVDQIELLCSDVNSTGAPLRECPTDVGVTCTSAMNDDLGITMYVHVSFRPDAWDKHGDNSRS